MSPTRFTLVGAGQVVHKYWLPSELQSHISIDHVVSLESPEIISRRMPGHLTRYQPTTGLDQTINIIKSFGPKQNIALLIPDDKLRLADSLLNLGSPYSFSIFWEKPYFSDISDYPAILHLINKYPHRIHLSGQYSFSRADILYPQLPIGRIPVRVVANLLEGSPYFDSVSSYQPGLSSHHFVHDGPELDLGFHLLDVVATFCRLRVSPVRKIHITPSSVSDLSLIHTDWQPGHGFTAGLIIELEDGRSFPMELTAGKFSGVTHRRLEFIYPEFSISQDFTSPDSSDPVFQSAPGIPRRQLDSHPAGYNYYSREISPSVFLHQTHQNQLTKILLHTVCLDIRNARTKPSLSPQIHPHP